MPAYDALNDALFAPLDEVGMREMANARAVVYRVSGMCGRDLKCCNLCVFCVCVCMLV